MNRPSPLASHRYLPIVLLLSGVLSAVPATAQNPLKWLTGDKGTKYQIYKDPEGRFEMEYPTKDWRILPSNSSSTLVGFSRNDGPTFFVDYVRLREKLTKGEIDAMPESEVTRLKATQPKAAGFQAELLESKAGSGVLIKYSRPGTGPESVIQYSLAANVDLYRLNGVVAEKQLQKYEPVIMHMIQSFQNKTAAAVPKH
jgi:hypothetical protein